MDDARIDQLTTLLEQALARPAAERDAFVHATCGKDDVLCGELASLLEAHSSAPDYFAGLSARVVSPAYAAVTGIGQLEGDSTLLTQLRGAMGDRYRIDTELGGGGMSRVFLAEEVRLVRKVVVKVLPPAMSATVDVERFRQEIRMAAQLQHPHIVPLLTADSSDTLLYYTMPFVVGESLRARLAREGPLPVADAVWIWRDVLDALTHAHASAVVHRDIKPANILLGVRNARVIDFGIARAIEGAADDAQVGAGVVIGTPAYMAPEQITGDPHADHRVDIYAAGLVMYEMLEGRLPFAGDTSRDLALARLTSDPLPPLRTECPPELRQLVLRCIAKDPAARPASAEEVLGAVENLPTDSDAASLVAASAGHRGSTPPLWRTRRLVSYAAAATVVIAAMVAASRFGTDRRGGADTPTADGSANGARQSVGSTPRYTPNIAAYEWYLRGMDVALMRNDSGRRVGAMHFQRAIAEDSTYAAAWAGLVRMYLPQASRGRPEDAGWLALAEQAARKAVALDDSLAEARSALGWIALVKKEFPAARAEFERAIALDPNVPRGYEGLARLYMWTGPPTEQLAAARHGVENDPYSHSAIRELGLALMMNGQCDEAIERLRPLKSLKPVAGVTGVVAGQCYASQGMWPEAIAEFRWALELSEAEWASALLGYSLARVGRTDEARLILAELLTGRVNSHGANGIAVVYAGLGDHDQAFAWLDKAADQLSHYLMGPMFSDLHRDPRFSVILKRIGP